MKKRIICGVGIVTTFSFALFAIANAIEANVDLNIEVDSAIALTIQSSSDGSTIYGESDPEGQVVNNYTGEGITAFGTSSAKTKLLPNTMDQSMWSKVTVYTNNTNGYKLTVSDSDENTDLVSNNNAIPAGTNIVAGTSNWAFKGGKITDYAAMTPASDATTINDSTSASPKTGDETTVIYGVSTSGDQATGTYSDTIIYTATSETNDTPTKRTKTYRNCGIMRTQGGPSSGSTIRVADDFYVNNGRIYLKDPYLVTLTSYNDVTGKYTLFDTSDTPNSTDGTGIIFLIHSVKADGGIKDYEYISFRANSTLSSSLTYGNNFQVQSAGNAIYEDGRIRLINPVTHTMNAASDYTNVAEEYTFFNPLDYGSPANYVYETKEYPNGYFYVYYFQMANYCFDVNDDYNPVSEYETEDEVVSFGGITTMQEMTTEICNSITTPDASVIDVPEGKLKDTRDGKVYTVRKLADGNCWMSQNLRLALDESTTLTPSTTNLTNNWTPIRSSGNPLLVYSRERSGFNQTSYTDDDNYTPHSHDTKRKDIGGYYNWAAAVAKNDITVIPTADTNRIDASSSICPKGWELPLTGFDNKSYGHLFDVYGYIGEDDYPVKIDIPYAKFDSLITGKPFSFVLSNYISGNYVSGLSSSLVYDSAYYLTRSAYYTSSPSQAYVLSISKNSQIVYTSGMNGLGTGNSIRCVAQ